MKDPRAISGALRIGTRLAPDGQRCLLIEWPDGSGLMLPRDQALTFWVHVGNQLAVLYPADDELQKAYAKAKAEVALHMEFPVVQ